MIKQDLQINHIPALLWGAPSEHLLIAVHGDQANKADAVIALLAEEATCKGYQVLSFDLPQHGERKGGAELCKIQTCVPELQRVLAYARTCSQDLSLFGCSIGAYFSLTAYRNESFRQALFLSPVVDLARLIQNMLGWFKISEEELARRGAIATPMGQTLYWDYYNYVKTQPVDKWTAPTAILWGERDELSESACIAAFCERFGSELTVMKNGEHFFHTDEQMAFFRTWLKDKLVLPV